MPFLTKIRTNRRYFAIVLAGYFTTFTSGFQISYPKPQVTFGAFQDLNPAYAPDYIDFAGEAPPFTDPSVREKFVHEMQVVVYQQAKTINLLRNATRWFPVIEEIFRKRGVPEDFKYVAIVESALDNNIISSKGATGFWQLMEPVSRESGMVITNEVDERYHIERSTEIVCDYFLTAYKKFGNWTTAAASYNRGMNGMASAISSQLSSNNFYDIFLNNETYTYIFRILAYKYLMQNPEKYGYHVAEAEKLKPFAYGTITVTDVPNLPVFAMTYKTTYRKLRQLNPWLRDYTLKPHPQGKLWEIKIPAN